MNDVRFSQRWLLEAVNFFRQLSFFESYGTLADEELLATLIKLSGGSLLHLVDFVQAQKDTDQSAAAWYESFTQMLSGGVFGQANETLLREHQDEIMGSLKQQHGDNLKNVLPSATTADLDRILLALDINRVWENDTETDVCQEQNVYVKSLKAWGAISRGAFVPEDIQEIWTSNKGPVKVTLTHQNQRFKLHPRYSGDFMDIGVLTEVNEIIGSTGIQFAAYDTRDQSAFVVALKHDEREKLEQERGWRFLGL